MKAPTRRTQFALTELVKADHAAAQFLSDPATLSDLHKLLAGATRADRELFLARVSTRASQNGARLTDAQVQFLAEYVDYGDQEADIHRDRPRSVPSK